MSKTWEAELIAELEQVEAEQKLKDAKVAEVTKDFFEKKSEYNTLYLEGKFKEGRDTILEPLFNSLKAEPNFGKQHPFTLEIKFEIGLSLYNEDNGKEAKPMLKDTLKWMEKVLGKKDELTLKTKMTLALCCQLLQQNKEAVVIFTELLPVVQTTHGQNHSMTQTVELNMAAVLMLDKESRKKASEMLDGMLARRMKDEGPDGEGTIGVKIAMADVLALDHKLDACVALTKEILASQEKTFGKEDEMTKKTAKSIDDLTNPAFGIKFPGLKRDRHFIISTENSAQEIVDYCSPFLKN